MKHLQVSKKTTVEKFDLNHFAVITVVFNPIRYRSKVELYHKFDEHMTRSGVTLLTVECIFEKEEHLGLPKQKFEITKANDPRHLQITAPSVFWLKENLINIAVKRLPTYVEYIAWLDADIEFERLDWPHLAIKQLQIFPIVQLFQLAFFLGPSGKKNVLRQDHSFVYAIQHDQKVDAHRSSDCCVHPGYAWAMRRDLFDQLGGLLEFSILGSADLHFAFALYNRIDETIPNEIHDDYRYLAQLWGDRLAQIADNGAKVGYLPLNIYHYWHGNRQDRRYNERWSLLEQSHFSPFVDLEKNNQTGLLRFTRHSQLNQSNNSSKRIELLELNITKYFRLRDEDNIKKPLPTITTTVLTSEPIVPKRINIDINETMNSSFWNHPLDDDNETTF